MNDMISDETRMLQDLVRKFVERELMPLEAAVLKREASTGKYKLTPEEEEPLLDKCRELGLWGLDVPEEMGGVNLSAIDRLMVEEEVSRTITPFEFPPDSPNLHMLKAVATPEQREKYMIPYAEGRMKSCIAISEPGAGGDPAGMLTRAVKDGTDWVINGRKIWVSRVPYCDFIILMARTGEGKREEGMTAFIVEKGTPGFIIEREIDMIGGKKTYELVFDDCRVPKPGAGRARPRLCADAAAAEHPPAAGGGALRRHHHPGDGDDGRAGQQPLHLRREAGGPAGDPVVDRRCRHQGACAAADGAGGGKDAGCRRRCAQRGLDDQGLCHRDGAGGAGPGDAVPWPPWA